MEVLLFSLNTVAPLILIVAVGFLLKKIRLVDERFLAVANKLCFQVAFPVQLFLNIYSAPLEETLDLRLLLFVLGGIVAVILLLCLIVPRLIKRRATCGAFIQGVFRSNFLLLGLPLAENLFGAQHIGPVSMLLPFVILLFNFSAVVILRLFAEDGEAPQPLRVGNVLRDILLNPLIIGSLLGLLFSVFRIPLPQVLMSAAGDIGRIGTPLALLLLGGQFDWARLRGNWRLAAAATALRLLVIPGVFVGLAVALGFEGPSLGAVLIVFGAPTAVSSYIMAGSMHSDEALSGQLVLTTTLFSGITIFLWVSLLRAYALI